MTRIHTFIVRPALRARLAALAVTAIIGASLFAPAVHAQGWKFWSSIAADGAVDERDKDIYDTAGPRMQIRGNAPGKSTLNVRYAVTWNDDDDYRTENDVFYWYVRFRDNGDNARVKLMLKSYDQRSGEVETLITFDSDTYDAAEGYQFQSLSTGDPSFVFEWEYKTYYVDAVISRKSAHGKPGLGSLVIWAYE